MKDNETRLATTGVIWGALTLMMIAALIFSERFSTGLLFGLALMFTVGAVSATRMVWRGSGGALIQIENAEKAKRHSRVDRMLDKMSESELDELRSRLMADGDGENVSLEELLAEREQQRR